MAGALGVDEAYIWPEIVDAPATQSASVAELLAMHPTRASIPHDTWAQLMTVPVRRSTSWSTLDRSCSSSTTSSTLSAVRPRASGSASCSRRDLARRRAPCRGGGHDRRPAGLHSAPPALSARRRGCARHRGPHSRDHALELSLPFRPGHARQRPRMGSTGRAVTGPSFCAGCLEGVLGSTK